MTGDNSSMTMTNDHAATGTPGVPGARLNDNWRLGASAALVGLILVCLAWETVVAPLRPGGSWMVLKAVPLLLPLRGILRGRLYTYQWAAMLALLYVMEGAVRATSDTVAASALMGWLELLLAGVFFVCAVAYVRPAKRAAKLAKARRAA